MPFDLKKLLADVFDPEPGEVVTVACDEPRNADEDSAAWRERRVMAAEWQQTFAILGKARGFTTNPLLHFPATGISGGELPAQGRLDGRTVGVEETLEASTLATLLTQFSATAALDGLCRRLPDFRAASLPGLERRMERTSLTADYREVARRCAILAEALQGAGSLEVTFSTGHRCVFDLRHRKAEMDDGILPRGKVGDRVINLPSGETFIVPYEGELPEEPSQTAGEIPLRADSEIVLFHVADNRIARVEGVGAEAQRLRDFFAADPARCNIAEVAFGCNPSAQVTGNVLEDEKAGFHWAYGRSDHLGGSVGVSAFASPETVVHHDIVDARGNPIQVADATIIAPARRTQVIRDGEYVLF